MLIIISVAAAIHAYMFGKWLVQNENRTGAYVVFLIAAACVGLPIYRQMTAP